MRPFRSQCRSSCPRWWIERILRWLLHLASAVAVARRIAFVAIDAADSGDHRSAINHPQSDANGGAQRAPIGRIVTLIVFHDGRWRDGLTRRRVPDEARTLGAFRDGQSHRILGVSRAVRVRMGPHSSVRGSAVCHTQGLALRAQERVRIAGNVRGAIVPESTSAQATERHDALVRR